MGSPALNPQGNNRLKDDGHTSEWLEWLGKHRTQILHLWEPKRAANRAFHAGLAVGQNEIAQLKARIAKLEKGQAGE